MSTKKIREALEGLRNQCPFGPIGEMYGAALTEVEAIEKAAREYFTWGLSPESRGVLTAISQEIATTDTVMFEPGTIEYVPPADPYTAMVREFHQRMGLVVRDAPSLGTPAEREERVRLMLEELLELARALGVSVLWAEEHIVWNVSDFTIRADGTDPEGANILHELADLQVTVSGTAVQFGLPLLAATREIHTANMQKTPQGPGRKPLKPEGWKPAGVSGLVSREPRPRSDIIVVNDTSKPHRPRVVVESPYAGDVERNRAYLAAALRDCLRRGEAPFASHGLYTLPGVLDDTKPEERELGISAGFEFHGVADRFVVYTDLGLSSGMKLGIANAALLGVPVEYRTLPGWGGGQR